jgi:CrcB protein
MNADVLWVMLGGFFGAVARCALSRLLNGRWLAAFPLGTLAINVTGSFLLGWLAGARAGGAGYLLAGTGFMGAYTTFSTFNVENVQLALNGKGKVLAVYAGLSYGLGLLLAYAGYLAGERL